MCLSLLLKLPERVFLYDLCVLSNHHDHFTQVILWWGKLPPKPVHDQGVWLFQKQGKRVLLVGRQLVETAIEKVSQLVIQLLCAPATAPEDFRPYRFV